MDISIQGTIKHVKIQTICILINHLFTLELKLNIHRLYFYFLQK